MTGVPSVAIPRPTNPFSGPFAADPSAVAALPRAGLRSVRIGIRLTCCFAAMTIVMLLGAALAVWEMSYYNGQVERLRSIDRRMIAVLKVNNRVLSFREAMQEAAANNDTQLLSRGIKPFREAFLQDAEEALAALRAARSGERANQKAIYTLMSYQTAVPGEVDTMLELASYNDWQAIHFRLDTQIQKTSRVLAQVIGEMEADALSERRTALNAMTEIRRRVMAYLPISTLLAFVACAILLGRLVTRSIAAPLQSLERGAKILGSGDFMHRVPVQGKDELAVVANAFNTAAEQIERLHSGLESEVAQRTADLRRANENLRSLSEQDPLTGVANRRTFDRVLHGSLSVTAETGQSVSLLMVDVDHFKSINDTHGHQKGDECLRQVVRCLRSVPLRGSDLIARFGGEEFAVILPSMDSGAAIRLADQMRSAIATTKMPKMERVTVSIGVATSYPDRRLTAEELIEQADQGLYRAKQSGRNQVCCLEATAIPLC